MFPGMDMEAMMAAKEAMEAEQRRLDTLTSKDAEEQLGNCWVLLSHKSEFTPGQLVKPIKGLHSGYVDPPGGRYIYAEKLELDDERINNLPLIDLSTDRAALNYDCVLMRIMPGGACGLVLHDSRFIEPVRDASADNTVVPIGAGKGK